MPSYLNRALAYTFVLPLLGALACGDARTPPPAADSAAHPGATSSSAAASVIPAAAAVAPKGDSQAKSAGTGDVNSAPATPSSAPIAKAPTGSAARKVAAPVRRIVFGGVDFTGVGYDRGNPSAPVVVIDLSDFACPYCAEFSRETFPAIDREYVRTGKVLFKYIPFVAGPFPHAAEATRAAECAADQGRFWPALDQLYARQAQWKHGRTPDADVRTAAVAAGVDAPAFDACYAGRGTDARTARATAVANEIGVRVTPSFLVDGNPVQGALPVAEFRKQIEVALLLERTRAREQR